MANSAPTIGQWYIDPDNSQLFEIVAIDDKTHCLEIQYADGDISEIDEEYWQQSNYESAVAPEDGNAGYGFNAEDLWSIETAFLRTNNPLENLEPELFEGLEEL